MPFSDIFKYRVGKATESGTGKASAQLSEHWTDPDSETIFQVSLLQGLTLGDYNFRGRKEGMNKHED